MTGRRAGTLAAVLLGFLTLPMLMSGTTVALPLIGADLGASGAALQWVVVGYFLAAAAMMLVAGSLGDLYGRRRVFAAGALVYTAGALASALAGDILTLNVARTLSGVGAAGVMTGGGAVLGGAFTGRARTRAYAAMGTTAGVGMAVGPSLAGWLVGALGWRAAFAVFAGAGLLMLAGAAAMADSRAEERPRVDVGGALALIGALGLTMFGVNQAAAAGWASVLVLVPLAGGLAMLVVFVLVERRARHPVLDLGLLRDRRFVAWTLAGLVLAAGPAGVTAYLPTYLQGAGGLPVQAAGLIMLGLTTPVLLLPQVGGLLINRGVPPRALVTASLLLIAAGNAWLTTLRPDLGVAGLLGPLATLGTGMGLMIGITDAQAVNQVAQERIGMATGLLNTVRAGGGTLATTLFGTALATGLHARAGDPDRAARILAGSLAGAGRAVEASWLTGAWQVALWGASGVCAVAAPAVWALLAAPRPGRAAAAAAVPAAPRPRPSALP
ncbi:putative MFS family arabinose efflux permease [Nonomuraea thailandensis]|uniref:MFS family arabinose efflux permease n=1 Tax=Nonomuraea thailandensis TaxID=1188745 RepID=A0A9X2GFQ6_9ACTN|nr:MFS transporter [Nonomuraea thailandensis]MCP2357692.1 putative MFS family arabinose efflux permease [Nonomuraea thailandensis]